MNLQDYPRYVQNELEFDQYGRIVEKYDLQVRQHGIYGMAGKCRNAIFSQHVILM